ncbi:ABC transporter permease [bacterium]|nr:ABC transporter permease [bacterium]
MKALLWKALFTRVLWNQRRLFIIAVLTVSLGVALALGIRLGTQSAVRSLETQLKAWNSNEWSEPLLASSTEAKSFLREIAFQRGALIFNTIDSQLGESADPTTRLRPVQLLFLRSGPSSFVVSSQTLANQSLQLQLLAHKNCKDTLENVRWSKIAGKNIPTVIEFREDSSLLTQNCKLLIAHPASGNDSVIEAAVSEAALTGLFPTATDKDRQFYFHLRSLASFIPGLEFDTASQRLSRLENVTASFRTNLQLMGFIALFIGFAMVQHVFSLLVARQAKSIATLSALGISGAKQIRVLLSLAGFLGLVASAIGTLLGLVAGVFLSGVTSATVKNLYDSLVDSGHLHWQPMDLGYGFFLGFSACFLGALQPIFKLRRLPVSQLIRDGSFEAHDSGLTNRQSLLLSILVVAITVICLKVTWVVYRIPITALISCLGVLIFSALSAQIFCRFLYEKIQLHSFPHRWTTQLRVFLPPQAAIVVQVLTLTFTLTFGVKGMAESFRETLADWANSTLRADIWIRSVGGNGVALPDEVVNRLAEARGKEAIAVDALTILQANLQSESQTNSKPILFAAARFSEQKKVSPMRLLLPKNIDSAGQQKLAALIENETERCTGSEESPCPAYISEPILVHFSLPTDLHKTICPIIKSQKICFESVAVYQDFGSDQGVILSDEKVLKRILKTKPSASFSNVYLREPLSPESGHLIRDLRELVKKSEGTLALETLRQLKARILETFDNTFRVTDALYVLCGVIAIIATVSGLNLQIMLRNKEWSTQWALGIGGKPLIARFAIWSSLMAFIASLVSVCGGWALSAILVYVVNYHSFGYSLQLAIPWHLPILIIAVATLSGGVSGFLQATSLREHLNIRSLTRE